MQLMRRSNGAAPARLWPAVLTWTVLAAGGAAAESVGPAGRYDVTWGTPSGDHSGSMPLGNGDVGLNAWVEKSGDLAFYISKTDSWGDNARLLKVGKVRIKLSPSQPVSAGAFRQTLDLARGTMEVRYGAHGGATVLRLWVDASHPAAYVELEAPRRIDAKAVRDQLAKQGAMLDI